MTTTVLAEQTPVPVIPDEGAHCPARQAYDETPDSLVAAESAEAAGYTPRHAYSGMRPVESIAPGTAPERRFSLNDRVLTAIGSVHAALTIQRNTIAAKWDTLPRWRQRAYKAGAFLTSLTGITIALQLSRMTGVVAAEANMLADSMALDGGSLPGALTGSHGDTLDTLTHAVSSAEETRHNAKPSQTDLLLAVRSQPLTMNANSGDLPAGLDTAPDPKPLGEWNKETGDGTIWNQTVEYADRLGYGDLTERQKWELTDHVLDELDITWDEARRLSPSFEPEMPSQRMMIDELEDLNAERTHAPDRAPAPVDAPADGSADRGSDTDGAPDDNRDGEAAAPGDKDRDGTPDRLEDERNGLAAWWQNRQKWLGEQWHGLKDLDETFPAWMSRNWLTVAGIGALLVAARMAQNQLSYGSPFRRPTRPDNRPTQEIPPVAGPVPANAPLADPHDTDKDGDTANPPASTPRRRGRMLSKTTKLALIAEGLAWWRRRRKRQQAAAPGR